MAQSDQLEAVADSTVLGRFENPQKLVFVFGVLSQSPLKESAYSAGRKLAVSFRIISNDWVDPQVSHNGKGNCTL